MKRLIPALLLLSLVFGYFIGLYVTNSNRPVIDNSGNKLDYVLNVIDAKYVDQPNIQEIIEKGIPKIIAELDPHSAYIPQKEMAAINEDLHGSFSGIGIRFTIQEDTIHIGEVIHGGPSEQAGLLAGDRIITVNDTTFVGKGVCTNDAAMKKLKGPKGSFVKLGVLRYGDKNLHHFNIRRDDVIIKSIESAYLIDNKWGYIQVERFGENTYSEFMQSALTLAGKYAHGFIIDLRGNGGGYLEIAYEMANQLLKKDEMIVYTEGRQNPKREFKADGNGMLVNYPVVILVDETSASASEILAGAIQDNDRGTVIGRRTFGKGLVQEQIPLEDGSALRLTVARYYTPSGRCIQKPYTNGEGEKYALELIDRYNRGEFFNADSIQLDKSLEFKTKKGRTVYGGGGIMPDIFIPSDTTLATNYASEVLSKGHVAQFALKYATAKRQALSKHTTYPALLGELKKEQLLNEFVKIAEEKGIARNNEEIQTSREFLEKSIHGSIIYHLLNMNEYTKFNNVDDPAILKAVEILNNGQSYP